MTLLSDYGAATEVYVKAFNSITEQPANQWEKTTHQLVVDATFHDSHELSTQEMIDRIAQHAPDVFFAGDAQKLQSSYEALIAAYQSHASMLRQIQQPIAQWSRETVTAWAKVVKQHYHQAGPRKFIPQGELLGRHEACGRTPTWFCTKSYAAFVGTHTAQHTRNNRPASTNQYR